jgi:hypothetical protein
MSADFFTCLALDIGGANLKGAHSSGGVDGFPFELWKRPGELAQGLVDLASRLPAAERIAVTMTAELCDCYVTRSQGVLAVLDAVETAFPGRPTLVWGVDAQFHAIAPVRERPLIAAASNWLALATVAAALVPDGPGLLIDIGSTTADLIPLADGKVTARGEPTSSGSRPASWFTRACGGPRSARWLPNCPSEESPPRPWPSSSPRRSTFISCSRKFLRTPPTGPRPTAAPRRPTPPSAGWRG